MWFDKEWERLNEYQKAAVEDDSPACVVNATVGSGKTTVLISKVIYLHVKKQIPYENMVVLTFTNKAAGEIRQRLLALEPELNAAELEGFGTFHSVAMNLLKRRLPLENAGWKRDFHVITPDEEMDMALQLAAEQQMKIKYKNRLKKRMEQEYEAYAQGREESRCGDDLFLLLGELETEKKRQNKMAFSDLIAVSTRLLTECGMTECGMTECGAMGCVETECGTTQPAEPEPVRHYPDWIIIDEVQDSDRRQLEFVTALKGEQTKLFVVGDPNQLIYSWRGSMDTMFYLLKNRFQAKELTLPINYRSSSAILEASRRFLQFGNELKGSRGTGSRIVVKNHYDPFQEAQYLAGRIHRLHEEGGRYGDIAVFYRLQMQSEVLEKVFGREGIPFSISQKKTIREIPALEWFINVLRFSCSREDTPAGISALSNAVYGEGMTKKKAREIVLDEKEDASPLYGQMRGFGKAFGGTGVPEPEEIGRYFDLDRCLKPNRESFYEDRRLIAEFCKRLADYSGNPAVCGYQKQKTFPEGVSGFLDSSALYGAQVLNHESDSARDTVKLMTLHASKGLEFGQVFIIGVNQGLIPLWGKNPEAEEEERRLFFVGMTRAKDNLELSYYTNPGQARVAKGPGRFLKMIPGHLVDWEGQDGEEKRANLQQMRKAVQEEQQRTGDKEEKTVKRVRHPKYGEGILVGEDEATVEAEFANYGRKQFLKAFSELQMLD